MKNSIDKMYNAVQREERKKQGYFDGRFRQRTVISGKHKPTKYKHKLYEA